MTTYPDVDNGNAEIANAAKQALVNDIEGYTLTNTLKNIAKEKNITVDVLNKLADFPVLGDNTSGWYIPTPGQLWSMLVNLGEYTGSGDVFNQTDDKVARRNAVLKMNEKITGTASSTPVRGNAFGEFTWSSVEANATNMWAAKFNTWTSGGQISLDKSRPKGQSQQLRPVFAF